MAFVCGFPLVYEESERERAKESERDRAIADLGSDLRPGPLPFLFGFLRVGRGPGEEYTVELGGKLSW